jgi:LysM repeat protein
MALVKLKIEAYADVDCTGQLFGSINAMFNPDSYSRTYKVNYKASEELGKNATTMIFTGAGQNDLALKLIIDGTGVVPIPGAKTVDAYIKNFKSLVYNYNGTEHRPNYLKVSWGANDLAFVGICESISIAYSLFNPDGSALRAVMTVKFIETVGYKTKAKQAQNTSPDLTHIRTVKAGDTLPLMTFRIYGDSSYYLQVAKANNLSSVSAIKPGDQIFFPPIKK